MAYISIYETYRAWSERMKDHGTGDLPFCIAFCGVFSSGKTSLINRLLQSDLPTGINPVTKMVTRIQYGEAPAYYYVAAGERIRVSRERLYAMITGDGKLPDGCRELLIELPSALLKNNVEIIDTPGYEDDSALEDMSRTAVLTADLILFCTNALVLGKQFEKAYLEELSKSHGNFCLIVNRIDALNTDEEYENVCKMAAWLMEGKGQILGEAGNGRYFPTIGSGKYANLNGLDQFLTALTTDRQRRSAIRASTNRCFSEYNRELLSAALEAELAQIDAELETLKHKNALSLSQLQSDHDLRMLGVMKDIEDHTYYVHTLVKAFQSRIEQEFKAINDPRSFVNKATHCLNRELAALKEKIAQQAVAIGMDGKEALGFLNLGGGMRIPAPDAERRVTRGTAERVFNTLGNLFSGSFSIDDGESWVWKDYHTPAIDYVMSKVSEDVDRCWERICGIVKRRHSRSRPDRGGYEAEMEQLENRRRMLRTVSASFQRRMKSVGTGGVADGWNGRLRYMMEQTQGYRDLLSLLSMPDAFVTMMNEQIQQLKSMMNRVEPAQAPAAGASGEVLAGMFGKMCRAYVTLSRRPNNPQGAEEILSRMMEHLDDVYRTVMGKEQQLTIGEIREYARR